MKLRMFINIYSNAISLSYLNVPFHVFHDVTAWNGAYKLAYVPAPGTLACVTANAEDKFEAKVGIA